MREEGMAGGLFIEDRTTEQALYTLSFPYAATPYRPGVAGGGGARHCVVRARCPGVSSSLEA